jgi:lipopolysaccharide transport system ATP-binding protein
VAALAGIDFELRRGESLGIVGENGAGKSTLLKLLAGVTMPSAGGLAVRGKVASLLELGMGFHPEFSGRQNIRLNAAIMGIGPEELEEKAPQIIAFSELGAFIDRPVKTYSTGMTMRLGFAIAIHVDPEILIIDEALSVGDGYFQKKCMDAIFRFVETGRTLLFCSHAMYYVSAYCEQALWLHDGKVQASGKTDEVIEAYESHLLQRRQKSLSGPQEAEYASEEKAAVEGEDPASEDLGVKPARLVSVQPLHGASSIFKHREPWQVEVAWESVDPQRTFHVGVGIDRLDGVTVCSFGTHRDGIGPFCGSAQYRVRLRLPELPMIKGSYSLYIFLLDEAGLHVYDQRVLHSAFSIESRKYHFGLVEIDHDWEILPSPELSKSSREGS